MEMAEITLTHERGPEEVDRRIFKPRPPKTESTSLQTTSLAKTRTMSTSQDQLTNPTNPNTANASTELHQPPSDAAVPDTPLENENLWKTVRHHKRREKSNAPATNATETSHTSTVRTRYNVPSGHAPHLSRDLPPTKPSSAKPAPPRSQSPASIPRASSYAEVTAQSQPPPSVTGTYIDNPSSTHSSINGAPRIPSTPSSHRSQHEDNNCLGLHLHRSQWQEQLEPTSPSLASQPESVQFPSADSGHVAYSPPARYTSDQASSATQKGNEGSQTATPRAYTYSLPSSHSSTTSTPPSRSRMEVDDDGVEQHDDEQMLDDGIETPDQPGRSNEHPHAQNTYIPHVEQAPIQNLGPSFPASHTAPPSSSTTTTLRSPGWKERQLLQSAANARLYDTPSKVRPRRYLALVSRPITKADDRAHYDIAPLNATALEFRLEVPVRERLWWGNSAQRMETVEQNVVKHPKHLTLVPINFRYHPKDTPHYASLLNTYVEVLQRAHPESAQDIEVHFMYADRQTWNRDSKRPIGLEVLNMTEADAEFAAERHVYLCEAAQFLIVSTKDYKPTYLMSLDGFLRGEEGREAIEKLIREKLAHPTSKFSILAISLGYDPAAMAQSIWTKVLNMGVSRRNNLNPVHGINLPHTAPLWVVYLAFPTDNSNHILRLRQAAQDDTYDSPNTGMARHKLLPPCAICQSIDHPGGLCPLKDAPGYIPFRSTSDDNNATTNDEIENLYDNIGTNTSNSTSHNAQNTIQRGGRGRGRGMPRGLNRGRGRGRGWNSYW